MSFFEIQGERKEGSAVENRESERAEAASHAAGKTVLRALAAFFVTAAILISLLLASALIPKESLRVNTLASAEYLCETQIFGTVIDGVSASRIDRYADAILLGIAWQLDAERPLESVMRAAYYHKDIQNENRNLLDAVERDLPANQEYLRYWHGSIALVRPLLLFLPLTGICALNGVLLAALALVLLGLLYKRRAFYPALGLLLGMACANFCFVPLSLEYTWVCLLALAASIGVLACVSARGAGLGSQENAWRLFLISGMLTSFLDFLTAETLTLLVPLLLWLWLLNREGGVSGRALRRPAAAAALAWGGGYAGMWALKWLLAALVLREKIFVQLGENIGERLDGSLADLSRAQIIFGAVWRNLACTFPLGYGTLGALAFWAVLIFAFYRVYVYRRPGADRTLLAIFALIGLVPVLRMILLHNHAFLHCFFTCRAFMATVMAAVLILEELTKERGKADAPGRKRA